MICSLPGRVQARRVSGPAGVYLGVVSVGVGTSGSSCAGGATCVGCSGCCVVRSVGIGRPFARASHTFSRSCWWAIGKCLICARYSRRVTPSTISRFLLVMLFLLLLLLLCS